jgi:predicted nucleic-acid-binding Zn-ribbon protein
MREDTAMTARPKLRCTKCGGEMNHHAEKVIMTSRTREQGYDSALGGYIEESHSCPNCGYQDTRRAG